MDSVNASKFIRNKLHSKHNIDRLHTLCEFAYACQTTNIILKRNSTFASSFNFLFEMLFHSFTFDSLLLSFFLQKQVILLFNQVLIYSMNRIKRGYISWKYRTKLFASIFRIQTITNYYIYIYVTSIFPLIEGLAQWNQTRQQWRECRTSQQCRVSEPAIR